MTANDGTAFSINKLKIFFQSKRAKLDAHLASHLVEFIGATKKSLDCAIYDLRYPDVLSALHRVLRAGKKLRIAYHGGEARMADIFISYKSQRHSWAQRLAADLERYGKLVKLTVTHEDYDQGSKMLPSISKGWPAIMSSLKSLLESGQALDVPLAALEIEGVE